MRSYEFHLPDEAQALLFAEAQRIHTEYPAECLANDQLWSDRSEKANGITRDRATGTLCYSIGIYVEHGEPEVSYALREDSSVLLGSALYKTVSALIAPYEKL